MPTADRTSRILIIEDEPELAHRLVEELEFEGYQVDHVGEGGAGIERCARSEHDLVILDLTLPDLDGLRVLSAIRSAGNDVAVLILSCRCDEVHKVMGFRLGADDYVTKPYSTLELLGRVHAILRRTSGDGPARDRSPSRDWIRFGDIEIMASTHTVFRRGVPVELRPKEYDLLLSLVRRGGDVVTRLELLRDVWGYDDEVVSRTVDTHVAELRRKLEDDPASPRHIITIRKAGYRLLMA